MVAGLFSGEGPLRGNPGRIDDGQTLRAAPSAVRREWLTEALSAELLARVDELAPVIAGSADESERLRRLAPAPQPKRDPLGGDV